MSLASITIKTDAEIKKEFNDICEELGLNMSVAINIFMKTVLRERGIPFDLKLSELEPNELTRKVLDESAKGKNLNGPYDNVKDLMEALDA
ncbi:type II toxin-antitoxin system RelB/DinJ family antitoxin [Fusobacterium sp.]|uniref:type II toxin-antitoxin system RelB/DinJ family antitoxin n=1 Tax=Fusobacterium sp. TaxID=68766 RepID=UPI002616FB69|nr:type II toxin-antitoxin system RelB/DinJ family antitoxin [Fusobacterium sp.]